MSDIAIIAATRRDRAGKGVARATRRAGLVPAVIYGDKQTPVGIAVEPKELVRMMHRPGFLTHRLTLDVEGTKYDVLPRDVQLDVVTDRPLHFDFLRLGPNSIITVDVPVNFRNDVASPGIKRGGVLNIVRHEITVRTRADQIPASFELDLTGLEIGDTIHLSAIVLPEGVRLVSREKDATIASIAPPTTVAADAPATTAAGGTAATATATSAAPGKAAAAGGKAAGGKAVASGGKAAAGGKK